MRENAYALFRQSAETYEESLGHLTACVNAISQAPLYSSELQDKLENGEVFTTENSLRMRQSTVTLGSSLHKYVVLLYDLKGMSYPDDREKLMRIIMEKDGKCTEAAVRMLAYEQEREVLRNLAVNGKRNARLAAIEALRLPADRDIIDVILSNPESDLVLKKYAARLLPNEDPMLDQLCCPFCGSFGSIYH